ncbi:MAG: quinolinate synthase NadA [Cyanobacteria bacterium SIG30]|nr:quinolinate synthase NadA [Cyanobacteria bacterium SIG30]
MSIIDDIKKLKKEKNAVILAHCYQNAEIDEVADFVGDSLYLSRCANKTDADIIVFAGVYFMAETAKILSPNKKVLLPKKDVGCFMANTINLEKIKEFKAKNPNIPVVCYVNSTAEVKAECDICCTSANAVNVVKKLGCEKVLFVPDMNLGTYVNSQLENIDVISYSGYCPVHAEITTEQIKKAREQYPNAKILAHPECKMEVLNLVDYIGSTTGILNYVNKSTHKDFVIVTEKGVVDRLKRDYKDKNINLIQDNVICPDMKKIHLEDIYNSLKDENYEIKVDEKIAQKAIKTIEKMIKIDG